VLTSAGIVFAAFGVLAASRGLLKNGALAILLGCAAPLTTQSPVALVLSIPTLVVAFGAVFRGLRS
jgi:hypothetical protein